MIRTLGKTTGLAAAQSKLAARESMVAPERLDAMAKAGAEYAAQKSIQGMMTTPAGRTHRFGKAQRRSSSLPWQYPAIQDGDLVGSFAFPHLGTGRVAWDAGGSGVPQAFYMEFGTSKIIPRPFMRTTIVAYRREILDAMRAAQGRSVISTATIADVKAGG